jgi:hypothetical protein
MAHLKTFMNELDLYPKAKDGKRSMAPMTSKLMDMVAMFLSQCP